MPALTWIKPAVLFEGEGYNILFVTNVHGSWANHALMMGIPEPPVRHSMN